METSTWEWHSIKESWFNPVFPTTIGIRFFVLLQSEKSWIQQGVTNSLCNKERSEFFQGYRLINSNFIYFNFHLYLVLIILHASRTAMPSGFRVCIWLLKERAWLKTTDQSEAGKNPTHSSLPLRSDPALAAVGGVLGTWLTFLWSFIINAFWANKRTIFKKINNIFSLTFCSIQTSW